MESMMIRTKLGLVPVECDNGNIHIKPTADVDVLVFKQYNGVYIANAAFMEPYIVGYGVNEQDAQESMHDCLASYWKCYAMEDDADLTHEEMDLKYALLYSFDVVVGT